jgi:hypothetical protein
VKPLYRARETRGWDGPGRHWRAASSGHRRRRPTGRRARQSGQTLSRWVTRKGMMASGLCSDAPSPPGTGACCCGDQLGGDSVAGGQHMRSGQAASNGVPHLHVCRGECLAKALHAIVVWSVGYARQACA